MKIKWVSLFMLILLTISCSIPGLQNPLSVTSTIPLDSVSSPTDTVSPQPTGAVLNSFHDVGSGSTFTDLSIKRWDGITSVRSDASLPLDLNQIANPMVISGLTQEQRVFLAQNGFVILHTQEPQFYSLRKQVAKYYGQPYYLTTDAAYHVLHLTFDETLKALEKEKLRPQIIRIINAALENVMANLPMVTGKSINLDAHTAAAYLAVAAKLFDPQANVETSLEPLVSQQVEKIIAASGLEQSMIIPDFQDDYGAYKPVGHYAGDSELEAYFRGMTWLGRSFFKLNDPTNKQFSPSRAPLIITLALRQATIAGSDLPATLEWAVMHEVLTYLIGPSDDAGPMEYAKLMDKVYGDHHTIVDIADEAKWSEFQARSSELPAPQINSTFINTLLILEGEKGWRFMGQRFTLDALIIQNLIYDKVGTPENPRMVPSGLDVMAVLGSRAAMSALDKFGMNEYQNYDTQQDMLKQRLKAQSEIEWLNRVYSSWLYALLPQLVEKVDGFPPYMRTATWAIKELNSALGSWAELKHDTVLYSKMPEPAGGGGPPSSGPTPSYVEPNPDVFYRLSYLAYSISEGLTGRYYDSTDEPMPDELQDYDKPLGLSELLALTKQLGDRFNQLGDIAAKELRGEDLDERDYEIINGCLGPIECMVIQFEVYGLEGQLTMPPVPIISAVSGAGEEIILQAATGYVDRLYVAIPLDGKLYIAQGGVFSYYEFTQPRDNRLTDQEWRNILDSTPPQVTSWMEELLLPGGKAMDILTFRIGDWYIVNKVGAGVNLRSAPSMSSMKIKQLDEFTYFEIIDGPRPVGEYVWWNVQTWDGDTGWLVESQKWYERARGQ